METLQRLHNRGSVSTVYDIDNSLKLEANNSENLYRNLHASTSTTKFTHSAWYKRTELGSSMLLYMRGVAGNEAVFLRTNGTADTLQVDIGAGGTNSRSFTTQYVRDTSAWYHLVLAVDTTQSTATDRFKLYINGNLITDYSSRNNPSQNFALETSSAQHRYGSYNNTDGYAPFSGYIAECNYIDGLYLDPTSFGEFDEDSGIWKPKQYTGSYGTGGYYLDFSDSSDLGANSKGDDTNFTLRNIAAIEQANDSPTNNFCVFNALANTTPSTVLSEGGCLWDNPAGQNWQTAVGTFALTSGKWYWETRGATYAFIGIADIEDDRIPIDTNGYYLGYGDNNSGTTKSIGMYSINGQVYNAPSGSPDGDSYTSAHMIGIALDMDNRKMWYSKDGTWITSVGDPTGTPSGGVALTHLGDTVYPAASASASNGVIVAFGGLVTSHISSHNMTNTDANGYGAFKSSPPSGYYAICSKNLAEYGG